MEQWVLIVAKCIVNEYFDVESINPIVVLIVAKCIVNNLEDLDEFYSRMVLIVAKCIVNKPLRNYADRLIEY